MNWLKSPTSYRKKNDCWFSNQTVCLPFRSPKLQNLWTMKYRSQCPTNSFEVIDSIRLNKYPKYDAFLLDMVGNTGQNQWTMKYRPQWPTKCMRALAVWNWTNTQVWCLSRLDRSRDLGQNHWTMQYRPQWLKNSIRSLTLSDWTSIQSLIPSYLK